jgi:transcriptional regulator with XRE-family HTH domain
VFDKVLPVTLGERLADTLRKLREQMGLTQRDMAAKLGISQPTLARLEGGAQNIKLEVLERVCRSLRCDVGDLFSGRVEPPSRRRR